jgi:hypothetical protein
MPLQAADMLRKLFLTSLILFVDVEYGSSRLLRLLLASIVSAVYLGALALARPYKRSDDLYLACTSNMLLTCCFVSGFAIKLCEQGRWKDSCQTFMGFSDSYRATAFVVLLSVAMLVVSTLIIVGKVAAAITAPAIRLVSSGREPLLDMPADCQYHAFVSHVWGTGQDQTHSIVRQLKLLMPDIQVPCTQPRAGRPALASCILSAAPHTCILSDKLHSLVSLCRGDSPTKPLPWTT